MGNCNLSVREQVGGVAGGVEEGLVVSNMGNCNLSVREQVGGVAGGVAEGLVVIWASVICPSIIHFWI